MWPLQAPNGWRIHAMRRTSRSAHVRKHLLNPQENWNEISTLSAREIRSKRAEVQAAGCPCGPSARDLDAPGSAGHALALDLFVRDYAPVSFLALVEALDGVPALATRDGKERRMYVVTVEGLVVAAAGPDDLWWRTSFRVIARHRPHGRAGSAARRLRWALYFAETLADSGGKNHE